MRVFNPLTRRLSQSCSQAAPKSNALREYDQLCAKLGCKQSRQSDCDVLQPNFSRGFSSGTNLMGHEVLGCLQLPCFTIFTDDKGNKYRAHPCYNGKAWNDSAMVEMKCALVIIQHSSKHLSIFEGFRTGVHFNQSKQAEKCGSWIVCCCQFV
jgi:hypothetical protein